MGLTGVVTLGCDHDLAGQFGMSGQRHGGGRFVIGPLNF
jgi:hypothetical protein